MRRTTPYSRAAQLFLTKRPTRPGPLSWTGHAMDPQAETSPAIYL